MKVLRDGEGRDGGEVRNDQVRSVGTSFCSGQLSLGIDGINRM
jgi:hypothetical protein